MLNEAPDLLLIRFHSTRLMPIQCDRMTYDPALVGTSFKEPRTLTGRSLHLAFDSGGAAAYRLISRKLIR